MQLLATDDSINIQLGSEEWIKIASSPILFNSPVTYLDPNKENLPEEDFYNDHEVEEEIIENEETFEK